MILEADSELGWGAELPRCAVELEAAEIARDAEVLM